MKIIENKLLALIKARSGGYYVADAITPCQTRKECIQRDCLNRSGLGGRVSVKDATGEKYLFCIIGFGGYVTRVNRREKSTP